MTEDDIISRILVREGSAYTKDPVDRGGATKYGITQRAWDDYVNHDPANAPCRDVEALTEPWARAFYHTVHIQPLRWIISDQLLEFAVDSSVQHGRTRTVRWLQVATGVSADGVIGPDTMRAVQADETKSYRELFRSRLAFYTEIVVNQPGQLKFLRGWMRRLGEFA